MSDEPTQVPRQLEGRKLVGDKRTGLVYDLEAAAPSRGAASAEVLAEVVAAGAFATFGPDTLAEARNRGYTLANGRRTQRWRHKRAWRTAR